MLSITVLACLVAVGSAKPSGLWGYGHGHGHLPLVGASGVVSSGGAVGPAGVVTGHGAIGPNGEHNSLDVGYGHGYGYGHGHGHLPLVGASGIVSSGGVVGPAGVVTGNGAIGPNGEHNSLHGNAGVWGAGIGAWGHGDDGQWHGEGLLASQDWAGHHGGVVAPISVVGHGIGHAHW